MAKGPNTVHLCKGARFERSRITEFVRQLVVLSQFQYIICHRMSLLDLEMFTTKSIPSILPVKRIAK
jgi:hypothetical protein